MEAHREAYREILRWTEGAATAAEQGDTGRLVECLRRRQELMGVVESLPPPDLGERARLREEALPLLEAALRINHGIIALLAARRARLARILMGGTSRFVDTRG
ncbi:MAG: hypothetical protein QN193_02835 [Armatimonadota bacterium]|nr:hypothetical protein [Armatimonadota bacterium]MDR7444108.1 hypothetical protein [Armatimonadota bacterium]MDR7569525.1 hypothetical protein [Armatimonadota bacterium]MDR7613557.1 hypothetical protein [Armatimonadota bacterium]